MSYSDTISIVNNTANRIFTDKTERQKVQNSIKNAINNFTNFPTHQIPTKSYQFNQQGQN